jgi:hypothetical protein
MFSGNFNIAVSIADEHSYPTFAFDNIDAALFDTSYGSSLDIEYIMCMQGILDRKCAYRCIQ